MISNQSFNGKSTSISNSNGFRFDASLFKANPEFFGEVRGTVLVLGQMLVSVVPTGGQDPKLQDEEGNPVMLAFLSFLEGQMAKHPNLIEPVTEAQMAHIATLVDGVESDLCKTTDGFCFSFSPLRCDYGSLRKTCRAWPWLIPLVIGNTLKRRYWRPYNGR
jgi:hypothetical protein